MQVKLLAQEGELYVLAQSRDRVAKERAMRRRQLKRLWARLKQLSTMPLTREELLMKAVMTQDRNFALEDRARLTEIQDLLFERIIERKEAIERGQGGRAKVLETEIKELKREKENIRRWITVGSA